MKKKRQEYNYIRQNDLLEHALQNRTYLYFVLEDA